MDGRGHSAFMLMKHTCFHKLILHFKSTDTGFLNTGPFASAMQQIMHNSGEMTEKSNFELCG